MDASKNYSVFCGGAQGKKRASQKNCYKYYPFGLQTAGSWTRENTTGNNFLSNAASEQNSLTGWTETFFRPMDVTLGRFHGVDPLAAKYDSQSPYQFANNDPVYWSDPSGAAGDFMDVRNGQIGTNANSNADAMFSAGNAGGGMYGVAWNVMTYGSWSGAGGGSAFARYGPGDGGALRSYADPIATRLSNSQTVNRLIAQAYIGTPDNSISISYIRDGKIDHHVIISIDPIMTLIVSNSNKGGPTLEGLWGALRDQVQTAAGLGAPWMPFIIGIINTKECSSGPSTPKMESDNSFILNMLAAVGVMNGKDSGSNSNAWCAATVNWALAKAGIQGTGSPSARSFIGYDSELCAPTYGAIGVQVDGNGNVTHVGFFDSYSENGRIKLLGGNQGGGTQVQYSKVSPSSFIYWCMPTGYAPNN